MVGDSTLCAFLNTYWDSWEYCNRGLGLVTGDSEDRNQRAVCGASMPPALSFQVLTDLPGFAVFCHGDEHSQEEARFLLGLSAVLTQQVLCNCPLSRCPLPPYPCDMLSYYHFHHGSLGFSGLLWKYHPISRETPLCSFQTWASD